MRDYVSSNADLEWKLIYVGSAEDEKYDQVLESVLVGPVNVGHYRFVFQVTTISSLSCVRSGTPDFPGFFLSAHNPPSEYIKSGCFHLYMNVYTLAHLSLLK